MAARALTEQVVRTLVGNAPSRALLPTVLLASGDPEWRAVVGLIQVRAGGFAIVAPAEDEVWEALAGITGADGEPAAMTTEWTVEMETSRRRPVGGRGGRPRARIRYCRGSAWRGPRPRKWNRAGARPGPRWRHCGWTAGASGRARPKQPDALAAALSEPGSSSGGGVRGHTAREAYLKQLEDSALVAGTIRKNACQEMGIPLEDAFCGRGVMVIEQMILDSGRVQVGWLLGSRPYAKLASPAWAAANLAF